MLTRTWIAHTKQKLPSNNNPVKSVFTMGDNAQTFTITQADVDIITATNNFISLATSSPKDPDVVKFQSIIKDGKATLSQVNTFFQGTTSYKTCTYISYMLVMTTLARTPVKPGQPAPPVQSTTYSLSKLCSYLGVPWPSAFDIQVSNFSCSAGNDVVKLGGIVDLTTIKSAFDPLILPNILSFLPLNDVRTEIIFNYGANLQFLNTTLEFMLDNIKIPVGVDKNKNTVYMNLNKPTVVLSIAPTFKFVVLVVKATIPFSLFNSPTINADVSMAIDNLEASIGVVLEEPNATFLTPPVMKGVHFDSVGIGMGV